MIVKPQYRPVDPADDYEEKKHYYVRKEHGNFFVIDSDFDEHVCTCHDKKTGDRMVEALHYYEYFCS